MSELTAGRVPKEMSANGGGDVEVVLVDKQSETYEVPFGSENWRGGAKGSVIGSAGGAATGTSYSLECGDLFNHLHENYLL